MRVGFVGAGRMGRPMVARLVQAGHHVSALGRPADKRRDLERLGATAVHDTYSTTPSKSSAIWIFPDRGETATVGVTVKHSAVKVPARTRPSPLRRIQ